MTVTEPSQLGGTLQRCCIPKDEALVLRARRVQESACESQKTLGGFITAPGLPAHVWGQPGSLTRKPETLPGSSEPNSYQSCCLTHDLASTSALMIRKCWCFPALEIPRTCLHTPRGRSLTWVNVRKMG